MVKRKQGAGSQAPLHWIRKYSNTETVRTRIRATTALVETPLAFRPNPRTGRKNGLNNDDSRDTDYAPTKVGESRIPTIVVSLARSKHVRQKRPKNARKRTNVPRTRNPEKREEDLLPRFVRQFHDPISIRMCTLW